MRFMVSAAFFTVRTMVLVLICKINFPKLMSSANDPWYVKAWSPGLSVRVNSGVGGVEPAPPPRRVALMMNERRSVECIVVRLSEV